MTEYRRFRLPGATWFFTVNLAERSGNRRLVEYIDVLRAAFRRTLATRPFRIDAIVVLPEHLHSIWTLPPGDEDFSTRWRMIKADFSRGVPRLERITASRSSRRERGIWQRRFWARALTNQVDFNRHMDYVHWNPVKHGHAVRPVDWPYSSLGRLVDAGVYEREWALAGELDIEAGE
ncbi:MAG: transposase [Gammaproteobacteria bacterium]|nr:transposase [Gammaproteobacteria bacterium]